MILAALVVALSGAVLAPTVAADPFAHTIRGAHLYRIDLPTVELEQVGPIGDLFVERLAFHADGTLYGIAHAGDTLRLMSFDLDNGAGTVVAEIELDLDRPFYLYGFTGDACGGLWLTGHVYDEPLADPRSVLLSVDAAAGTVGAPVEIQPVDPSWPPVIIGLAPLGDVLLTTGPGGVQALEPVTGATWSLFPAAPVALNGMDVSGDGALWTVHTSLVGGLPTAVWRMDLATGEITGPGASLGLQGLAIAPPGGSCGGAGPVAIPTLSPLALLALAGALGAVGLGLTRRCAV